MVLQHKEIKELKSQVAELSLQLRRKAVTRTSTASDDSTTKVLANVRKLGAYFQLFYTPIINAEVLNIPKPNFTSDSPFRYTIENGMSLGVTAEVYECIPEEYHELMTTSVTFLKEVSIIFSLFPLLLTCIISLEPQWGATDQLPLIVCGRKLPKYFNFLKNTSHWNISAVRS